MTAGFGLTNHPHSGDDDGSDDFVIEQYRRYLEGGETPQKLSIGDLYEVEISHPVQHKSTNARLGDSGIRSEDTPPMTDLTREELSAKLETIETKMDARVESVSAKIDGFLSVQAERDKRLDAALAQISKDHGETKAGISSMKTVLIVTAVSSVLAIVFGIASFNTALTSNMISAFQLGKAEASSSATSQPASPGQYSPPPAATPKS